MKRGLSWILSLVLFVHMFVFLAPAVYAEGESSIVSLTAEDVTVSPLDARFDSSLGCFLYNAQPAFTVTLKDGTAKTFQNPDEVVIDGVSYSWHYVVNTPLSEYRPKGVYTETLVLYNYDLDFEMRADFQVAIEESPIQSIEVADVAVFEYDGGYYDENGQYRYSYSPDITVTTVDGKTYTGRRSVEIDGTYYSVGYFEQEPQSDAQWKAGQSYTVTAGLFGVTDTFTVTIKESPLASFELEDVAIPEKEIGVYKTGYYSKDDYDMDQISLKYTARLKDGTVIEGDTEESSFLEIDGESYSINVTHNQENEPWELGGTYTASVKLFGTDYPFHVTIVENPKKVVAFQAEDSTLMYGLDDWQGSHYDIRSIDDLVFARDFSLTLADGSVLHSKDGSILLEDIYYTLTPEYDWDTSAENLWALGNTFTVTATFQDFSDTFEMTIVESCIESIDFEDVTVIENANVSESWYDPETGTWEAYKRYEYYPKYTVHFKDGRKQTFDYPTGLSLDSLAPPHFGGAGGGSSHGCFPVCTDTQKESPWEAGNTYTASVSLFGFQDTVNVTVIENPVARIVPHEMKVVLTENYNGDLRPNWYDCVNGKFLRYEGSAFTVALQDGTVLETESGIRGVEVIIDDEYYGIDCKSNDQWIYNIQLEPGSYDLPVTVYAFGETYELDVSVEVMTAKDFMNSLDVADIEIPDIQIFSYDSGYRIDPEFDLVMKDGSKRGWEDFFVWNPKSIVYNLDYDEEDNLKIGETRTLTGSWFGLTDEFQVTVIENPIEKVVNPDIICANPDLTYFVQKLIVDENKEYVLGGEMRNTTPILFQLKDGTIVSTTGSYNNEVVIYNNFYYADLSSDERFFQKNKKYDAEILGLDVSVTFTDGAVGDLDDDGEATIADVMEACKVLAREAAGADPTDDEIACGDLDGDGEITIADVMEICKILARKG